MKNLFFSILSIFNLLTANVYAQDVDGNKLLWKQVQKGLEIAYYTIGSELFNSQVLLLKIAPKNYAFDLAITPEITRINKKTADIKTLVSTLNGVAGINANFFDTNEKALGLLVRNGKVLQNAHRKGNVLTGIFSVTGDKLKIQHRDEFNYSTETLALQAGPRLIEDSKPTKLISANTSSRRSGIALNKSGELIIFITTLRFPGASLLDIQKMLSLPELEIVDALNFDGGGSSQFYLEKTPFLSEEILISGGDNIPVALVIRKK